MTYYEIVHIHENYYGNLRKLVKCFQPDFFKFQIFSVRMEENAPIATQYAYQNTTFRFKAILHDNPN